MPFARRSFLVAAAALPVLVVLACGSKQDDNVVHDPNPGDDDSGRVFDSSALPDTPLGNAEQICHSVYVDDSGIDRTRLPMPQHPVALGSACNITIDTPPLLPACHVNIGTDVQYDSNPPSSGPHYEIWAAYQAFTQPVDRRYYVHNLEHGAIVFLYKCTQSDGCPDMAKNLQSVSDALFNDPNCALQGQGVRVRTVITPDPLLDTAYAAAAWGWTYTSSCFDKDTMLAFARQHYGMGTENLCGNGVTSF